MKKLIIKIITIIIAVSINTFADAVIGTMKEQPYTYSYFGMGVESFNYKECGIYENNDLFKGKKFKSNAKVTSPVYQTGTLLNFSDFIISLDFITTLVPNKTSEKFYIEDIGNISENNAEIVSNSIRFLYHYLLTKNSRIVSGFKYRLNTYKRYGLVNNSTYNTTEETSSGIALNIGYWYESKKAAQAGFRYMFSAVYGIPIYQYIKNTKYPKTYFDNTSGYNFDTTFYGGYTIIKGLEMGLFLTYGYAKKDGERKPLDDGHDIIWPKNISEVFRAGIQIVWNFN